MKKLFILTILGSLALSSCSDLDLDGAQAQQTKENAEEVFGIIDPNQDWSCINTGSVSITADAPLKNIVKVQVLNESPFFNPDAKILAEADVTKGNTVTLSFESPKDYDQIIAACVDDKGNYFIKPFYYNSEKVSFSTTSAARARATRAGSESINVSAIELKGANATRSFNAGRTIYANYAYNVNDGNMTNYAKNNKFDFWKDTNWENDMLWQASSNGNIGSSWSVVDGAIVRNVEGGLSDDEKAGLKAIFDGYLGRANKGGMKQDNLAAIREGSAVKFFNNQLISDGSTAITITPVQMTSSELSGCSLYYYYYSLSNVPSGMSEAEYIKQLPKFKAIPCNYTLSTSGGPNNEFFKIHEYLLPYYGDGDLKTPKSCSTDGKVYRIRNGFVNNNKPSYLTYLKKDDSGSDKMANIYNDNNADLANQLWQIFTTPDNRKILYNIGSKKFLVGAGSYLASANRAWGTLYTDMIQIAEWSAFYIDGNRLWFNSSHTEALGFNGNNNRTAVNKTVSDGTKIDWYFDEYDGNKSFDLLTNLQLEAEPVAQTTAVSEVIPKGYRIGFVLQKIYGETTTTDMTIQNNLKAKNSGCVYGYGELNRQINNFPDFSTSMTKYSMEENDPRIAMFNANLKTYLTFEDGADCNFSDMIIELGGYSVSQISPTATEEIATQAVPTSDVVSEINTTSLRSGVFMFTDIPEDNTEGIAYTMCFEDRPNVADYDLNDVVLRCKRHPVNKNVMMLTLMAAGANDDVVIRNIPGTFKSDYNGSYDLNNKEVHEALNMSGATGDLRLINTRSKTKDVPVVTGYYEVASDMTIPEFLGQIYIENMATGTKITVPKKGESPFALILPWDFDYPLENQSINKAYLIFDNWARNAYQYNNWRDNYDNEKIVDNHSR